MLESQAISSGIRPAGEVEDARKSIYWDGKPKRGLLSIFVAITFLAIVGVFVLIAKIPVAILMVYIFLSMFTFLVYAVDKSAAKRGAWRTSERTLHLLTLAGGWPGALIAQEKLRHKSKMQSFRSTFWITVLVNCGIFVWLLTPTGSAKLKSVVSTIVL
jgi:uncharacterized membrane protein YsdA (DUF1294 family)